MSRSTLKVIRWKSPHHNIVYYSIGSIGHFTTMDAGDIVQLKFGVEICEKIFCEESEIFNYVQQEETKGHFVRVHGFEDQVGTFLVCQKCHNMPWEMTDGDYGTPEPLFSFPEIEDFE